MDRDIASFLGHLVLDLGHEQAFASDCVIRTPVSVSPGRNRSDLDLDSGLNGAHEVGDDPCLRLSEFRSAACDD
jgi:hypothetical protein